jgi:hypothetical protein
MGGDGVYDVAIGARRFAVKSSYAKFSPDATVLLVGGDGVYDVATGQLRFTLLEQTAGVFNPDGTLLVSGSNVYEVATGAVRFKVKQDFARFSPDGALLVVSGDAIYDVVTGTRLFNIQEYFLNPFSPDQGLLAVTSAALGTPCAILGPADYKWPYRAGIVTVNGDIVIRGEPSMSAKPLGKGHFEGEVIVFARTSDSQWYKLLDKKGTVVWLSAKDVKVISMPDGVPVE